MSEIGSYVDIDNVCWDFQTEFKHRLAKIIGKYPTTNMYDMKTFYNISDKDYWGTVESIHKDQLNFDIFPWTYKFLQDLKNLNHHVTIITGRDPKWQRQLELWLIKHSILKFVDRVVCSGRDQKSTFFEHKYNFIYDDSPHVLEERCSNCIKFCVDYPYNRKVEVPFRKEKTVDFLPYVKKLTTSLVEK